MLKPAVTPARGSSSPRARSLLDSRCALEAEGEGGDIKLFHLFLCKRFFISLSVSMSRFHYLRRNDASFPKGVECEGTASREGSHCLEVPGERRGEERSCCRITWQGEVNGEGKMETGE